MVSPVRNTWRCHLPVHTADNILSLRTDRLTSRITLIASAVASSKAIHSMLRRHSQALPMPTHRHAPRHLPRPFLRPVRPPPSPTSPMASSTMPTSSTKNARRDSSATTSRQCRLGRRRRGPLWRQHGQRLHRERRSRSLRHRARHRRRQPIRPDGRQRTQARRTPHEPPRSHRGRQQGQPISRSRVSPQRRRRKRCRRRRGHPQPSQT